MSTIGFTMINEPWPFRFCPACDGTTFLAANESGLVVFTCVECGHRWRYLLGYLLNVEPQATGPPSERYIKPGPGQGFTSPTSS